MKIENVFQLNLDAYIKKEFVLVAFNRSNIINKIILAKFLVVKAIALMDAINVQALSKYLEKFVLFLSVPDIHLMVANNVNKDTVFLMEHAKEEILSVLIIILKEFAQCVSMDMLHTKVTALNRIKIVYNTVKMEDVINVKINILFLKIKIACPKNQDVFTKMEFALIADFHFKCILLQKNVELMDA